MADTHAATERRQTQRRKTEHSTRTRQQVRYHYYRNGREVSFSEAFR
jgi:hypothetical protein